ncbi:hypothetical protein KTH_47970 [Thermosporothrix hazakensis]|nr:hypothetical protein KTH_47970 [Thermosporothrix hazakensis]
MFRAVFACELNAFCLHEMDLSFLSWLGVSGLEAGNEPYRDQTCHPDQTDTNTHDNE